MVRLFHRYVPLKAIAIGLLDNAMITAAFLTAVVVRFRSTPSLWQYVGSRSVQTQAFLFVVVVQSCLYYGGFYDRQTSRALYDQLVALAKALFVAFIVLTITVYSIRATPIGRGVLVLALLITVGFVLLARYGIEAVWPVAGPKYTCLIVGNGGLARCVETELRDRCDNSVKIAGFFDPGTKCIEPTSGTRATRVTGSLTATVEEKRVTRVVVAMDDCAGQIPMEELVRIKVNGVAVDDAHATLSALTGHWWLDIVRPASFVFSNGFRFSKATAFTKRAIDVALSAAVLTFSLPLMITIAIAIKLQSNGPILYRQRRVGWKGRHFRLLKFRSMIDGAEKDHGAQWAEEADSRITPVGSVLRKYRLDELPQLLNIILGDMSLVGPRPERPEFVDFLRVEIPYYDERHQIRPGLTGWAQVKYRYGASVQDAKGKLEYDLFYIEHRSLAFDLLIMLKTVQTVLCGHGAR